MTLRRSLAAVIAAGAMTLSIAACTSQSTTPEATTSAPSSAAPSPEASPEAETSSAPTAPADVDPNNTTVPIVRDLSYDGTPLEVMHGAPLTDILISAAEQVNQLDLTVKPPECEHAFVPQTGNTADYKNVDIAMAANASGISVSASRDFAVQRRNVDIAREFPAICPSVDLTVAGAPATITVEKVETPISGADDAFGYSMVNGENPPQYTLYATKGDYILMVQSGMQASSPNVAALTELLQTMTERIP